MNSITTTGTRPLTAPAVSQAATVAAGGYPYAPLQDPVKDPRLTSTVPSSRGPSVPPDEMGIIARPSSEGDDPQTQSQSEPTSSTPRRRSRTGSAVPASNRFTITNMTDNEIPEDVPHTNTPGLTETPSQTQAPKRKAWPTAEEEKAKLYQEAKARVDRVQGGLDRAESVRVRVHSRSRSCPNSPLVLQSTNGYPTQGSPQSSVHSAAPQIDTTRWPTAEEEKIRLFTQAQHNARIVQSYAQDLNDSSRPTHARMASRDSSRSVQPGVSSPGRPPVISAGAALYSHAMASVNKPSWGTPITTSPSVPPPASQTPKSSRHLTAAEEKEMLRRYHDAARAVQRHHEANFGSPDGIMSSTSSSLPHDSTIEPYSRRDLDNPSGPAPDELPPPWVPSPEFSQTQDMSEKERYRIAFEARERAAAAAGQQSVAPPPPASPTTSPPADYYTTTGTHHPGVNGSGPLGATADGGLPPPWHPTPPVGQSGLPPHLRSRSPPVPPSNPPQPGLPHMLSAAEEKALLKAKYEAEEQSVPLPVSPHGQQECHSSPRATPSPGKPSPTRTEPSLLRDQRQVAAPTSTPPLTPPPLLPRPPASYIQETAEEDARLQDELANGQLSATASGTTTTTASVPPPVTSIGTGAFVLGDDDTFGLLRPSSPFAVGWDSISARTASAGADVSMNGLGSSSSSSPPPRPPKVPLGY